MKAIISEDLNFISAFNSVKKSFRENEILTSLFVAVGEGDDRKGEARRGERHRREGDHNKNSINYYQFCKMVTLNKFQKKLCCLFGHPKSTGDLSFFRAPREAKQP